MWIGGGLCLVWPASLFYPYCVAKWTPEVGHHDCVKSALTPGSSAGPCGPETPAGDRLKRISVFYEVGGTATVVLLLWPKCLSVFVVWTCIRLHSSVTLKARDQLLPSLQCCLKCRGIFIFFGPETLFKELWLCPLIDCREAVYTAQSLKSARVCVSDCLFALRWFCRMLVKRWPVMRTCPRVEIQSTMHLVIFFCLSGYLK